MSETPSTIDSGDTPAQSFGWDDTAELHKCADGGGLFHNLMTIRRGTVADLIRYVVSLPEEKQEDYAIQKDGDHTLNIAEIRRLRRRDDFPAP
ncbi:hypothetical protein [Novosphingobium sp. Leaf2]|uniref:hypothetical protein n=1 Tax=Novosphingobium sp. Leaf2 TaxID=1735670 RepID=UPI0006F56103|nr:hypothetical protein [Novosphingobium sp. Leaf2]KQM18834.1 hypothetical protein ASE49_06790 [Novosphingobium sp. Leaf2]